MQKCLISYYDTLGREPIFTAPTSLKVKQIGNQYIVANPDTGGWVAVPAHMIPLVISSNTPFAKDLYQHGLFLRDGYPLFRLSHPAYEKLYFFEFSVTPGCNLSCVYCANEGLIENMTWKALEELGTIFVDRVVEHIQKHKMRNSIMIEFSGGEPFINFPVIKHTVNYAKSIWNQHKLPPLTFAVVTNGTLINDQIIEFITQQEPGTFGVGVSIDGSAPIHNIQRPFGSEKASFNHVVTSIRRLRNAGVPVTSTISVITKQSQTEMSSMAQSLIQLGFDHFMFSPAAPVGRTCKSQLEVDPVIFTHNLFACLDNVLLPYYHQTGKVISENTLAVTFAYLFTPERQYMCRRSPCGGAKNIIAVMWNGDIYPCNMAPLSSPFYLGNIRDQSFDEALHGQQAALYHHRHAELLPICRDCFYRSWCQSPCPRSTYQQFHTLDTPSYYCQLMQNLYDQAFAYLLQADEETIRFLQTFCRTVSDGNFCNK